MDDSHARTAIAASGLRCTRQRLDVYLALASVKCHPTAEHLHRLVQDRCPGASLATVYNTLEALCGAGLARRIPTSGCCGDRYDADVSNHLHVVTQDGEVVDLPDDLAEQIQRSLPPDLGEKLRKACGCNGSGHLSIQLPHAPV